MSIAYTNYSDICVRFYDLVIDVKYVADFVASQLEDYKPGRCLFVGGFFAVAKELQLRGFELTVADFSEEMIVEARKRLPNTRAVVADLRDMPFEGEFDAVIVIGRVFTHMLTAEDSSRALLSTYRALKPGGLVLLDNYEDSKIQVTDYFNGRIAVESPKIAITRESSTELSSTKPFVVTWKAHYRAEFDGKTICFDDEMQHRAFSRDEMRGLLEGAGFEALSQGDNFDDTSFYTLARRGA